MQRWTDFGMTPVRDYVVDTGVFLRWFVPQPGYEHAREVRQAFLAETSELTTPDSVRIEFAHVLRTKGFLQDVFTRGEYLTAVRTLDDLGVDVRSTGVDAVERSAALAVDKGLRFFDAVVVELALRLGLPVLSSDGKLKRAMGGDVEIELLRGSQGG